MPAVLEKVRDGSVECASLLPTVATLRKWEKENPDLVFSYIHPEHGQRRVRVWVRMPPADLAPNRCTGCGERITWAEEWAEWHSWATAPAEHYVNVCSAGGGHEPEVSS